MTQEELLNMESSKRQHYEDLIFDGKRYDVMVQHHTTMAKILNCKITKDGNEWCCLYGDNIQDGICGFGKTPLDAILKWATEFGL